ncbi:SMI1/KNR4 family protein [Dokdonella sp.]|uniref:SMI1/KNR4 family protein n=1 Tax=Dokdonella sp. TaxID=2291710 RepID=UPI0031B8068D
MTDVAAGYEALARRVGITLPAALRRLLAAGRTEYGPAWAADSRERYLRDPPALIACRDFEWIGADASAIHIEEWLRPDCQQGLRFLPFAEDGGGDVWCLLARPDAEPQVLRLPHAGGPCTEAHASFADFACAMLLRALGGECADAPRWSAGDDVRIVRLDIERTAIALDCAAGARLRALVANDPMQGADGELRWLSPQALRDELSRLPQAAPPAQSILPVWQCETLVAGRPARFDAAGPPTTADLALLRMRLTDAGVDAGCADDALRALAAGDARLLLQELLLRGLWADVVDETQPEPQWIARWRQAGPSGFPFIDLPALERLLAAGVDPHDLTAVVRSAQVLMAANVAQLLDTPTMALGWDLPESVMPQLHCAREGGDVHARLPALYPCFAARDPANRHGAPGSLTLRRWMALPQATRDALCESLRRGGRAQAAALWKREVGGELREALDAVEELRNWPGVRA